MVSNLPPLQSHQLQRALRSQWQPWDPRSLALLKLISFEADCVLDVVATLVHVAEIVGAHGPKTVSRPD